MTIISILIAFALCYFIRDLGRLHRFEWVKPMAEWCSERCRSLPFGQNLVSFIAVIGLPLLLLFSANLLIVSVFDLGVLGSFILSLAVLVYTFGPHDLDSDIDAITHADSDEAQKEAVNKLLGEDSGSDETTNQQEQAVRFVFREALQRWFGTIFWFAVLGIYGAMLHRIADRLSEGDLQLEEEEMALYSRLRQVLDWPVAQLMTLSLAIATDFDSVYTAWKRNIDERGHRLFATDNGFLLASACQIVLSGRAARDGYADQLDGPLASLKQAMDLIWRLFGVWLTVLALLLLVDVIA